MSQITEDTPVKYTLDKSQAKETVFERYMRRRTMSKKNRWNRGETLVEVMAAW